MRLYPAAVCSHVEEAPVGLKVLQSTSYTLLLPSTGHHDALWALLIEKYLLSAI